MQFHGRTICLLTCLLCVLLDTNAGHDDHDHTHPTKMTHQDENEEMERANVTHYFIEKIFEQFGHDGELKFADFVALLNTIGYKSKVVESKDEHDGHDHRRRRAAHDDHGHGGYNDTLALHKECLTPEDLIATHHLSPSTNLDEPDFLAVCPAIIQQLGAKNCHKKPDVKEDRSIGDIPATVWWYSTIAVVVISLVGLLGVGVIPIMQKVFYNHLLQFLVALAVGALSGDALLHLIPHAMEGVLSGSHDHSADSDGSGHSFLSMWIGLTGLVSIFFFFLMERVLTIITRMKNQKKEKKHDAPKENGNGGGEKCLSKNIKIDDLCHDCEKVITMMIHPNKELLSKKNGHNGTTMCSITELVEFAETVVDETGYRKDSHMSHDGTFEMDVDEAGHSHGPVPTSVSAVAWMVILGDGIHNFSDGLAIGAGFANSVTVGVSTAIAVFCHELPHEIGDFAVLLRAGMKIKQAVIYNCLSSILCFIGMLIGVAIGNIATASLWIFAVVAGMFLYIALVDMLPEMTSVNTKKGENQFCHLLLQCIGMLTGSGIMFLIAYYEEDIKRLVK